MLRFPSFGKITALIGFFLLLNIKPGFGQILNADQRYRLNFRQLGSDTNLISIGFSEPAPIKYFLDQKLKALINIGYPFAQITFDTIFFNNECVVEANLNPGPFIFNGTVVNHGDTSLSVKLVSKYIRIKKNLPFSDERQKNIRFLLEQIPFAEITELPKLEFYGNQSIVHLNLVKRKTNYFTGILGLLPQSKADGGTIVTGNIDGSLNNLFGQGVQVFIKWNRFAPSSQMADVKLIAPVLNYNGLGFESGFELFRQDSTINRQRLDLKISTSPFGKWKFQLGYITSSSTGLYSFSEKAKAKIETNSISFSVLNNPFQSSGVNLLKKGFQLSLFPTLKKINRESDSKTFPQLSWDMKWRYPVSFPVKRFAIQTTTCISGIASKELTIQEQLRAGGNQSIRGFNENFFFLSQFASLSVQPQYLVDKSLLVGIFSDFLLYNPKLDNKIFGNLSTAIGFGFSIEIDIGSNSMQLSIANGVAPGIPFDLQTTKIHFGYVARF